LLVRAIALGRLIDAGADYVAEDLASCDQVVVKIKKILCNGK
jgi:hypothetical protein